ncbi:M23/M56 family metallopeptidase [Parahaliea mediterranea]|uniref:M23/M56 family metallopeptidase n=1 Tax=Parahaliea mediterranea TaxID=651086 RepID=UPI000E2F7930|nr:M23/M56 family metallopeptidase [Parahaliea mediterranea]
MTSFIAYHLDNLSFLLASMARHQAMTSLLGLVVIAGLSAYCRKKPASVLFVIWTVFLVWLVATALLKPAMVVPNWLSVHLPWAAPLADHPCDTPAYNRFSNALHDQSILSWQGLAVLLWALVSGVLVARHWLRRRRYRAVMAQAAPVADARLQDCLARWCRRYGIRRGVRLCSSDAADTAFTLGVLRPQVFLPRRFLRALDAGELDAVLAHELAHVKRLDDLWIRLQALFQSLFFFCPPSWFMSRNTYLWREHSCDALAASFLGAKRYGSALLQVARIQPGRAAGHHHQLALPVGADFLHSRIRNLATPRSRASHWFAGAVALLLLLVVSLLTAFRPLQDKVLDLAESERLLAALQPMSPVAGATLSGGYVHGTVSRCMLPLTRAKAHAGMDFSPAADRSVRVVAAGTVESVVHGVGSYMGTILKVRHHGGVTSSYAHLAAASATVGQNLAAGAPVGSVATGANLHFELRYGGRALDTSGWERRLW